MTRHRTRMRRKETRAGMGTRFTRDQRLCLAALVGWEGAKGTKAPGWASCPSEGPWVHPQVPC